MNLTELLTELSQSGIELWPEGDHLRCRAPQGALSDILRERISNHKQEILALLHQARGSSVDELAIPAVSREQAIPLSFAQEEIWLSDRFSPEPSARTIEAAFKFTGPLDPGVLKRALQGVFDRHEVLRTTIVDNAGSPFQVASHFDAALPLIDLRGLPDDRRPEALRAAADKVAEHLLDLSVGPLIRVTLFCVADQEHILHIAAHHIIFDVWSTWIFVRELLSIYEAVLAGKPVSLRPLQIQYPDFAAWQRQRYDGAESGAESGEAFWKRRLSGAPVLLDLPTDRPRGSVASMRNERVPFSVSGATVQSLRVLGQREGTTMFMNLLAAFQSVLCLYSGQDDILVGSPVSGRVRPELESMIGSFAYPLVFRTDLSGDLTLSGLLARVRETTLEAYRHQDVPFGKVVEAAAPRRNSAYTPVFQVMFTYPPSMEPLQASGLTVSPIEELHGARVDYDLFLALVERGTGLAGMLTYNPDLFDKETVAGLLSSFQITLDALCENPERRLSDFELSIPEGTRRRHAIVDGRRVDLAELEAAILKDASIEDVRVLARWDESHLVKLVAYVAGVRAPLLAGLRSGLMDRFPHLVQPDVWIPVALLPLRSDGRVDDEALAHLPAIDDALCRRCEADLSVVSGIDNVAVVAQEHRPELRSLHLADLLPDWKLEVAHVSDGADPREELEPETSTPRPAAFADGGPLIIPAGSPRTFTEALLRTAGTDKGIMFVDSAGREEWQSYASLLEDARRALAGLQDQGLLAGDRVILQVDSLRDHFAAFWACVLGGITPVTVAIAPSYAERNGVVNKLVNTYELLGRPPIITSERLVDTLAALESLVPEMTLRLLTIERLKRYPVAQHIHQSRPEDLLFFQLTSGSTGVPKCIQETHQGVIAHIHGSQQFNGYTPDDVCLNWLPLDHVVPILTIHLKDIYLGCREIQVKSDWILSDAQRWLDLIQRHGVTHTWAPNFAFKMVAERLAQNPTRRWDLSSVRFFMNAGEQVTLGVAREFLSAVSRFGMLEAAFQPSFGMAEVCTCMTYQNSFRLDTGARWFRKSSLGGALRIGKPDETTSIPFVDLGPPIPGAQIRITDMENHLLPEGTIGRFQIRGESVTPGYLHNESANREAFVGDGWFNSGDLGFILDGRLTLTGREKEMIVIRGANFYCYEIEDVVNGVDGVEPTFAAACATEDAASGSEGLAVFFVPRSGDIALEAVAPIIRAIQSRVTASLGIRPSAVIPLALHDFPKTTSGKIQRSQLKKALEAGHFSQVMKDVDLALENSRTIPDWFYRPVWVRKELTNVELSSGTGDCLLFADESELADSLAARLAQSGSRCVRVHAGPEFVRVAADEYRIDAGNPDHYRMLLSGVMRDGLAPKNILHLWTVTGLVNDAADSMGWASELDCGAISLICLAQALAQSGSEYRLLVVSNQVQNVSAGDSVVSERAMLPALIRTLAVELPWLHCNHLDISYVDAPRADMHVLRELDRPHKDPEVALRQGHRFVPRLEKVEWSREQRKPLPLRAGGFYIVSGGLGGIGTAVTKMLLQQFGCRVLVLGRTPAEARLENLRGLDSSRGAIRYEAVDVADSQCVREAAAKAQAEWGCELDGIFHLAGTLVDKPLTEETGESFAASLRAKVLGAQVLHDLVRHRPDVLFVSFSSVNGSFGGLRAGAYSAASRYLEAFARRQRSLGMKHSYCLSWSFWDGVGMSRDYAGRDLARNRGYRSISSEQGMVSMLAALTLDAPCHLIGLDGSRPFVRSQTQSSDIAVLKLAAYVTGKSDSASTPSLEIRDRFLEPFSSDVLRIDHLPLTPEGAIDRAALSSMGGKAGVKTERIAPRNDLERALTILWKELLALAEVGVHDNFFDLGGHSILLFQLHNRIQRIVERDIAMLELIRYPTIASFAESLNRAATSPTAVARGRGRAEARQVSLERLEQMRQMRSGQERS